MCQRGLPGQVGCRASISHYNILTASTPRRLLKNVYWAIRGSTHVDYSSGIKSNFELEVLQGVILDQDPVSLLHCEEVNGRNHMIESDALKCLFEVRWNLKSPVRATAEKIFCSSSSLKP